MKNRPILINLNRVSRTNLPQQTRKKPLKSSQLLLVALFTIVHQYANISPLYAQVNEGKKLSTKSDSSDKTDGYKREIKADVVEEVKHIGAIKYGKIERISPPSVTIETLPRPMKYGKVAGNSDEIKRNVLRVIALEKPSSPRVPLVNMLEGYAVVVRTTTSDPTDISKEKTNRASKNGVTRIVTAAQWLRNTAQIFIAPNTSDAEKEFRRFAIKFNNRTPEKISEYAKLHHWIPVTLEDPDFTINLTTLAIQTSPEEASASEKSEKKESCIKADFSNASEINLKQMTKICGPGFEVSDKVPNLNQAFYSISLVNKEQLSAVQLLSSLDPMGYYYQTKGCPPLGAPLVSLPPAYVKRGEGKKESGQVVGICAYSPGKDPSTTYVVSYQSLRRYLKLDKTNNKAN